MDQKAFTAKASGKLVPTIDRVLAFVPNDLPPKIDVAGITVSLADSMQSIGELRGACRRLPNPYVLVRPLQRREALTSSAMEGTFTTADHLLLAEAGAVKEASDESTKEVINYLSALDSALKLLKTLPISHRVLRRAHEILLSDLSNERGAQKRPGNYRTEQNWIGGRTIETARYVPPPPDDAQSAMDALERYMNRERTEFPTALIDLALIHYQIEAIHPFLDGNGRVGRMLISLMAVQYGLLEMPVLYLSPVLESRKDEYIDLMFNVSAEGAWEPWLQFFLLRVKESCQETIATIDRLIALQGEYRERVQEVSRSSKALALVDYLFETPIVSVSEASGKLGVTYAGARNTIEKLVEVGILREVAEVYPKFFIASEIRRASLPPSPAPPNPPEQPSLF